MSFLKNALNIINNGFRKWSIMFIVILIGAIFRITELLTGVEFVSLIKAVGVAFMGANAFEHFKKPSDKEDMSED